MKHIQNFTSPFSDIEAFNNSQEMENEMIKNEFAFVGVEFPEFYKVRKV